jgi:diguanylate cyclase (GGDEF)-like protein
VLLLGLVHESHRLAFRDELTELPGRRALNESLAVLEGRYAVAMVDVDHFKKFNDTHGHEVGDQVLRLVASELRRVGGGGRAFRYGGEEFTVLFVGRSAREALPHLEALRTAVRKARLTLRAQDRPVRKPRAPARRRSGAKQVSVTVSVGAAERDDRNRTPAQVLKAADKALYRAKATGRNRVVG